jgi:hypothetical protein
MDNFDLKKYLVENKVTTNSQMVNEYSGNTGFDYDAIEKMEKEASSEEFHMFVKGADAVAFDLLEKGYSEKQINDFLVYTISTLSIDETVSEAEKKEGELKKKPQKVRKVEFPNGTTFKVGEEDMEGGIVIFIHKYPKGYGVSGQEYDWNNAEYGEEAYTYWYDSEGNESTENGIVPAGYAY